MKKAVVTKKETYPLPAGILKSDLTYPASGQYQYGEDGSFEIWYTERFGWCIPTLFIRNPGRRMAPNVQPRTYAVTVREKKNLEGHEIVTIGLGPHVKAHHTVYVSKSRAKELQKFLDIRREGLDSAGSIRDRISSRRAQTSLRRTRASLDWL